MSIDPEFSKNLPFHFLCKGSAADVWLSGDPPSPCELNATTQDNKATCKKTMRIEPYYLESVAFGKGEAILDNLRKVFDEKFTTWMALDNRTVVRLYDVVPDEWTLYQEYCHGGDLRKFLKGTRSDDERNRIVEDILAGLVYLHNQDPPIAHGNISPDKIYITRDGRAKLGEFGLSRLVLPFPHLAPSISLDGMVRWMSPECFAFRSEPDENSDTDTDTDTESELESELGLHPKQIPVTTQLDIWSFGCTILEVMTGNLPYYQCKYDAQVVQHIKVGILPARLHLDRTDETKYGCSEAIQGLVSRCWLSVEQRPSSNQLMELIIERGGSQPIPQRRTEVSGQDGLLGASLLPEAPAMPESELGRGERHNLPTTNMRGTRIQGFFDRLVELGCRDMTLALDPACYSSGVVATGGFGDIWKGRLYNGTDVAIKLWREIPPTEGYERLDNTVKRTMRELYNWSKMNHENIQKLLGVVIFQGRLGIVSPWMTNGNLRDFIKNDNTVDRYQLCVQVATGVHYMHEQNIVHGDLKGSNILVSNDGVVKITDFDHSIMADCNLFTDTTRIGGGTARWMAPELLEGKTQRNKMSDVYALGMTLLEIITGDIPYPQHRRGEQAVYRLLKNEPPEQAEHFSQVKNGDEVWTLIQRCWDRDTNVRPTASQVLVSLRDLKRIPVHVASLMKGRTTDVAYWPSSSSTPSGDTHLPMSEYGMEQANAGVGGEAELITGREVKNKGRDEYEQGCGEQGGSPEDIALQLFTQQPVDASIHDVWLQRTTHTAHPPEVIWLDEHNAEGEPYEVPGGLFPPLELSPRGYRREIDWESTEPESETRYGTQGMKRRSEKNTERNNRVLEKEVKGGMVVHDYADVPMNNAEWFSPYDDQAEFRGEIEEYHSPIIGVVPAPAVKIQSGQMSREEMLQCLVAHGCADLSSAMDPEQFSAGLVMGGAFGDIWKGRLHDSTEVAIKVWRWSSSFADDLKSSKRAMREIYNWSKVKHEYVQELMGVIVFQGRLGMVSQWMKNGNLHDYIRKTPSVDRYALCMQVAIGVAYLHSQGMVHGGIKGVNVLIAHDGTAKVTDFGESIVSECSLVFSDTSKPGGGTIRWMAPELILDENSSRSSFADVYALGMTMLETITGALPYYSQYKDDVGVIRAIINKTLPTRPMVYLSDNSHDNQMWELLLKCWNHDPLVRPKAAAVVESLKAVVALPARESPM